MRVLVVEDDEGVAGGLRAQLRQQGCAVDVAGSVAAAWAALCAEPFDLVLLDLGLADGDGADVLRRVRQSRGAGLPDAATPILIMTARDDLESRVAGLDGGADDYVIKPFDPEELAARMRAARRRFAGRADPLLHRGTIALNPATRSVSQDGRAVDLSAREFDVLLALLEVSPRVLSRAQLEARLYNWDNALDSNAIEVHVHHLRRKLGAPLIRTVRGVGYFVPAAAE